MGVDLRLLPFDCDQGKFAYSHTILECFRRRELWDAIEKHCKPTEKVPSEFTSYCVSGVTNMTPYGDLLRYTTAGKLYELATHEGVVDNYTNRAIWAYFKELPPETKVALYWH